MTDTEEYNEFTNQLAISFAARDLYAAATQLIILRPKDGVRYDAVNDTFIRAKEAMRAALDAGGSNG